MPSPPPPLIFFFFILHNESRYEPYIVESIERPASISYATCGSVLPTYLGPLPPAEHSPSMIFLHRFRFWTLLPSSVRLSPLSFTSHSKSLLRLFLGRPRFLFLWDSMKKNSTWCYSLASVECGLSSPTSFFLLVAQVTLLPPIPTAARWLPYPSSKSQEFF